MATANEHLQKIAQELRTAFDHNPHIKVTPLDDDPPEKYEVDYYLKGIILDKDEKISEADHHTIQINIPFGFPHFPPSCTPKTPTFHPDFDQSAICIGDFWNRDSTLTKLIIHIAKMIIGEIYSTENSFNENAARWYQKNTGRLPFQELSLGEITSSADFGNESDGSEVFSLSEEEIFGSVSGALDNTDPFSSPAPPASAKKSDGEPVKKRPASGPPSFGKGVDNKIALLQQQNRFFELYEYILSLPPAQNSPEKTRLEDDAMRRIEEAKELVQKAEQLEETASARAALELYEKAQERVADFPKIDEHIARAKYAAELTDELQASGDFGLGTETGDSKLPAQTEEKQLAQPKKKKITFFEEAKTRKRSNFNPLPILAALLFAAFVIIVVLPYYKATTIISEAQADYDQCLAFLDRSSFETAKQSCDDAELALRDIGLFKGGTAKRLLRQIKGTLSSEKMEEGLSGRIVYEGAYIPQKEMSNIAVFKSLVREADAAFTQGNWDEAQSKYGQALASGIKSKRYINAFELQEVQDKKEASEVRILLEAGTSSLDQDELSKSKELLLRAQEKTKGLSDTLSVKLAAEIQVKLKELEYLEHLNLGKKYFESNNWENAITQYEKALKLQAISPETLPNRGEKSPYTNMAEAELFAFINKAKESFSKGKPDAAIGYYNQAIKLLRTKEEVLTLVDTEEIIQQIQRIILRTKIVQLKKRADAHLEAKEYEKSIQALQNVVNIIIESGMKDDREFKTIVEGTSQTIRESKEKKNFIEKIAYLEDNYKSLFSKSYSTTIPETLSAPRAKFLKYIGGREIYELQCIENNNGRVTRLVLKYAFNPKSGKWSSYSENN